MTEQTLPVVVLVEDEDMDVKHFRRLAKKHALNAEIQIYSNADDALRYIMFNGADQPHLLLTDLNMPGTTGHELIESLRANPATRDTIAFVLSTSDLPTDIERAYRNKVAGYIVKDATGESLAHCVQMLGHYLESVTLPPSGAVAGTR